jgi:hypothetical protein
MVRLFLFILLVMLASASFAVTVPSPSKNPKLFYRIPKSKKLENKEYITVKSDDFVILAKKVEEKEDHIYWRTTKIRIKNKDAVESWPFYIREMIKPMIEASTPKEPFIGIALFANPIESQLLNRTQTINAGYKINSLGSSKHELSHDMAVRGEATTNESTKEKTSNLTYQGNLIYDYNNFWKSMSYFAIASYNKQKTGDVYTVKDQIGLGILGLKYKFIKDAQYIKNLDFSYVPLYESYSSENEFKSNFSGKMIKKQQTIRHSFRFRLKAEYDGWNINYVLFYRPNYYPEFNTVDMQDIKLSSTLALTKNISERLELGYTNTYTYDILAYRSGTPRPDNVINTFTIQLNLKF